MRKWNSRIGRPGDRRCDSRHDLKWNFCLRRGLRFLATATENERIASFQTNHLIPGTCFFDQECIDLILRQRMRTCFFADIDDLGCLTSPAEHFGIGEVIVNDQIGLFDALFARNVTNPRSPGPAPTRKHLPIFFLTAIDLLYEFGRQPFRLVRISTHVSSTTHPGFRLKKFGTKHRFICFDGRQHANRRIAISMQKS